MSFDKDDEQRRGSGAGRRGYPAGDGEFKLKPIIQTYELSIPDIQKLLVRALGVPEERITITPLEKDGKFNGITVTVKGP